MVSFGLATVSELVDKRKNMFWLQIDVTYRIIYCALYASCPLSFTIDLLTVVAVFIFVYF